MLWNEVKAADRPEPHGDRRPRDLPRGPAHPPPERCPAGCRPRGRPLLPCAGPARRPRRSDGALRIVRLPVNRRSPASPATWPSTSPSPAMAAVAAGAGASSAPIRPHPGRDRAGLPRLRRAAGSKLGGVPLLLDLHEDMPEFFRDRFARPLLRPLMPLVTGAARAAAAAVADEMITVHEPLRQLSIARGVPPEQDRRGHELGRCPPLRPVAPPAPPIHGGWRAAPHPPLEPPAHLRAGPAIEAWR